MRREFTGLSICAVTDEEQFAAKLFQDALLRRTNVIHPIIQNVTGMCVRFLQSDKFANKDSFSIQEQDTFITFSGKGLRALIYAYSVFLRKTVYLGEQIVLTESISGHYSPNKSIRGHQLGYRGINNTYDAWSVEDYRRYYLDLMMFGCNTVEHIPAQGGGEKSILMRYDPNDLCMQAVRIADELDLDISLWYPNDDLPLDESVSVRRSFFEKCQRLDAVFPPGGDPGHYPADEFVSRVRQISDALKQVHPGAQMWPSAQAPHAIPDWGEGFIREMQKHPREIDGVITGPNRAFPLDELRRRLPAEYPIRLYPDLTHNVRCEYPVHVLQDDWHYSLSSALSRECINPRPQEYRLIHRLTRPYVCGSVSYSEGVNDDVNKMIWADMDFDPNCELRTSLLDYARGFLWHANADRIADLILALEANWIGDPAENPHIESTLAMAESLSSDYPALQNNWRFVQLLFRANCDAYVRRRRLFDLSLLNTARAYLRCGEVAKAEEELQRVYPADVRALREQLDTLAEKLFDLIGMQLDIRRFGASHWERGAALETIDLPVTDKSFYLNRLNYLKTIPESDQEVFLHGLLNRCSVPKDGWYFSFAEHGLDVLGEKQTADFYMDFQGDRPEVNNGSIPMSQLKLFDHFSFRCKLGGFDIGKDYKLRVSYSSRKSPNVHNHRIALNGIEIYCGEQYGGEKNPQFDKWYLAPNTETATYHLPASCFENGCAELVIEEPTVGVMLSELWVFPA